MRINKRRIFTDEFKLEAIRRVREDGRSPASVGKELGVSRAVIGQWLRRATEVERLPEPPSERLNESEKAELQRLRRDVERLKVEKDILKEAMAFFARENA